MSVIEVVSIRPNTVLIFLAFLFILYSISFVLIWLLFRVFAGFSFIYFFFQFCFLFFSFVYCFHYFNFAFAVGHNSSRLGGGEAAENIMFCYFQYTPIYAYTYIYVCVCVCLYSLYIQYNNGNKIENKMWQYFVPGSIKKFE